MSNRNILCSRNYRNVALLFTLFGVLLSLLPLPPTSVRGQSDSPTGEIAYVQDGDIYLLDLTTKQTKRLTNGAEAMTGSQIAWSPDGEWLAFTTFKDGTSNIAKVKADGTKLT